MSEKAGGYLYAIGVVGTSLVKIGYATEVAKRLTALQIGHPSSLCIIAAIPVASHLVEVEKYLHRRLQDYHQRGEWFDLPMDALQFEALVIEACAAPPAVCGQPMDAPVGERVRRVRRTQDLTQEDLATLSGLSVMTISRLEKKTARAVYADSVAALARALGVSTDYLLGLSDKERCNHA